MSIVLVDAIRADHALLHASRLRYDDRFAAADSGEDDIAGNTAAPAWRVAVDLVTNVGFQQLAVFRLAAACHRIGLTPLAMLLSRTIRHLYGAEMHYAANIEPGVLIVHGNGLVISRAARIDTGCVISQNVTLGISAGSTGDDGERVSGAPHLHAGVHVGPGAVLVGPISVGANSKIAPNAAVFESVPESMVVAPAPTTSRMRATSGSGQAS